MNTNKKMIGNQEWCAFPDLGIPAIKARVDSGAKTSSIHAFNIRRFTKNNTDWVTFEIHPIQKNNHTIIICEAPIIDKRDVKSSSGDVETRYVISSLLCLGDEEWFIELTLTDRDAMGFRMLLGREAMNNRLIIDPSQKCLLGKKSSQTIDRLYL